VLDQSRALDDLKRERRRSEGVMIPSLIALAAILTAIVVLRVIASVREGDARSAIETAAIALVSLIMIAVALAELWQRGWR
jgi:hypothetical protein